MLFNYNKLKRESRGKAVKKVFNFVSEQSTFSREIFDYRLSREINCLLYRSMLIVDIFGGAKSSEPWLIIAIKYLSLIEELSQYFTTRNNVASSANNISAKHLITPPEETKQCVARSFMLMGYALYAINEEKIANAYFKEAVKLDQNIIEARFKYEDDNLNYFDSNSDDIVFFKSGNQAAPRPNKKNIGYKKN